MVGQAVAVVELAKQEAQAHQDKDSLVVLAHRHQAHPLEPEAVAVAVVQLVLLLRITVATVELEYHLALQVVLFFMRVGVEVAAEILAVLAVLLVQVVAGME
jgi:hypothetical protein